MQEVVITGIFDSTPKMVQAYALCCSDLKPTILTAFYDQGTMMKQIIRAFSTGEILTVPKTSMYEVVG